ncbi:hypothetical protein NM208_g7651 [Fusarium decemcellulare]|uniref:Uncharacterized protein n=1 Tax=Fusarium decemcellulare TaxID=57161 RepID=A0ACC1S883_9HYPO|nr:hypothetical protein NM208_g7651 [Fusarium decemcellulare]
MGSTFTLLLTILGCLASTCVVSLDVGIINSLNVMESFSNYFELDATLKGLNVSILYAGCVFAVPITGWVLDRWGRRRGLMIGASITLVGAILQASAQEKIQLLIGRFLLGISFVITATGAPSLLMEVAPPSHREEITNAMIACLPATGTIGTIVYLGIYNSESNWAWRAGLMVDLVGPVLALLVLPFTPESIRWLVSQGQTDEALRVLAKVRDVKDDNAELLMEFNQIKQTIETEIQMNQGNLWRTLMKPAQNFRRFLLTILTNIFYQTNGATFVPYFFTIIIQASGVTETSSLLKVNVGLSAWATLSSISGIFLISKMGRKAVLLFGTAVISLSYATLAILQQRIETTHEKSYAMGAVALCFIFYWATFTSWMLLAYSYPPEILKYSQRARGVGAGQAIGYAFGTAMTYTVPIAIERISWKYYIINCLWNIPIFAIIWWTFPETKGRTLEEIDAIFNGSADDSYMSVITGRSVSIVQGKELEERKTSTLN